MNKTINLENISIDKPNLDIDISVNNIHHNVSSIFSSVPLYEIIMIIIIFIMSIIWIKRINPSFGIWKTMLVSSTLISVFSFIMIYAELFSSYFTFGLSIFIWFISAIITITTRR